MREIKFRGKREDTGEWVYGSLLFVPYTGMTYMFRDAARIVKLSEIIPVDPKTVGQYTGLKDRNGREIYEGDIVLGYYYDTFSQKEIEIISYVRWDESGYWTFDGERRFCGGYLTDVKDIRVAGNIHDNAKLLKGDGNA